MTHPHARACRPLPAVVLLLVAGCGAGPATELGGTFGLGQYGLDQAAGEEREPAVDDGFGGHGAIWVQRGVGLTDTASGPRVGARLGVFGTRDESDERPIAGDSRLTVEDFADLSTLSLAGTVGYRFYLDPGHRLDDPGGSAFVEPGIAVGPAAVTLAFGSDLEFGGGFIERDYDDVETELALMAQPYLRVGGDSGFGTFGVEGGYQWTTAAFDGDLGRHAQGWYVGVFASVRLD